MRNKTNIIHGGMEVKKALFAALVVVFVLGFAAMAYAYPANNPAITGNGTSPSVINPATGQSIFTYMDLHDGGVAKYQGGYRAFNGTGTNYASNGASYSVDPSAPVMAGFGPHGGYDTSTNKCKTCHAVHRAEGAYYLLRADSEDDACDYCHISGSAHSSKVVYTDNPAGTATPNGHTMGASTAIPDSTSSMHTVAVTISGVDANMNPVSEDINVRSYETTPNQMYRLEPMAHTYSGHPLEGGTAGSITAQVQQWGKVGPLALRCMNCHQVHDAIAQVWRPMPFNATQGDVDSNGFLKYGYNLLRRYPSAGTAGSIRLAAGKYPYYYYGTDQLVKVPETALSAGVNYSTSTSNQTTYLENGVTNAQPTWVVSAGWSGQNGPGNTNLPLPTDTKDPRTVNNLTLSVWCADCHNLNIGGTAELQNEELGFHAHAERTHPAPYAHGGQCYSCHRDDLNMTIDKVAGTTTAAPALSSCSRCHYSDSDYASAHAASDFPHSGTTDSIKLLGAYSVNPPVVGSDFSNTAVVKTITEDNLDAVCIRCHTSIGVHN